MFFIRSMIIEGAQVDAAGITIFFLLIVPMFLSGSIMLLLFFYHRVEYSLDQIKITSKLNKSVTFSFDEITNVEFSGWRGVYIIHLSNGRKVSMNQMLIGAIPFLKEIEKRTGLNLQYLITPHS